MLVLAGLGYGQTVQPHKLRFNGIGLDSTHQQVLKALGKPAKQSKPVAEECVGGRERSVEYDGVKLQLMDFGKKSFKVVSFDVTSPKYSVSGIKAGDTQLTVRRVLGNKFTSETEEAEGTTTWTYDIGEDDGPGSTTIRFKKGKVVSISSSYLVC